MQFFKVGMKPAGPFGVNRDGAVGVRAAHADTPFTPAHKVGARFNSAEIHAGIFQFLKVNGHALKRCAALGVAGHGEFLRRSNQGFTRSLPAVGIERLPGNFQRKARAGQIGSAAHGKTAPGAHARALSRDFNNA